ncbi:MAG: cupin [Omnitrophica bacterium RIFCSPHIGHO2_02_FULL_46_11]|nr:MAG: cupin [Omnitrophica bacterium RIFCSPLOWO2_01_FULL_45_10b]OGW87338.1 MAG: cupin [Omnitrophica bacterium RIFCSPHIGHO2_02_FULL_46_11]
MAKLVDQPAQIKTTDHKIINEFIGRANSKTSSVSIALLESPVGWKEPGQVPGFAEYSVVLEGILHVETKTGSFDVNAGQAIIVEKDEWVRYSTPKKWTKYLAVCIPAFSPDKVYQDE